MTFHRRGFLRSSLAGLAATTDLLGQGWLSAAEVADSGQPPIVDTHQHLWDLSKFQLAWLSADAPDVLRKSYQPPDYREATKGLNVVQAVYMEVDVIPEQHLKEAETIIKLCETQSSPTVAAVISGRPNSEKFPDYVRQFRGNKYIKGIRQVLHSSDALPGLCLEPQFVKSVQLLGELQMSFDLCMRPTELADAAKLIDRCPGTRFILDHCGNADPKAFSAKLLKENEKAEHDAEPWRKDIGTIAKRPNVVCKISGIVAGAPKTQDLPGVLAPAINHCLDTFGPDRVMFGGDWPVCLVGASYAEWVTALKQVVKNRDQKAQRRLFHDNALAFYGL